MRILHIAHQYSPHFVGGTERYTQALAEAQAGAGHTVAVITPAPLQNAPVGAVEVVDEKGVEVIRVGAGPRTPQAVFRDATLGNRGLATSFAAAIGRYRPDLIHVQHLMGIPLAGVRAALQARPYLVSLHDYWWICVNAQRLTNTDQRLCDGPNLYLNCGRCVVARAGQPALTLALPGIAAGLAGRNARLRPILQRAKRLLTPSHFVAEWYQSRLNLKEVPTVLPLGVARPADVDLGPPLNSRARLPLRLLFVGGLAYQKGVHVALDAVRGLAERVTLVIVGGDGPDKAYADALRADAPAHVHFTGLLDAPAVSREMRAADLLVMPSLWHETFGLVISEAFLHELPVLVSDLGGPAERVTDGVNGFRLPPGDAAAWRSKFEWLSQNRDLLARLKDGIPPLPTPEEHMKGVLSIYESMMSV